jgi:hypothetical protein
MRAELTYRWIGEPDRWSGTNNLDDIDEAQRGTYSHFRSEEHGRSDLPVGSRPTISRRILDGTSRSGSNAEPTSDMSMIFVGSSIEQNSCPRCSTEITAPKGNLVQWWVILAFKWTLTGLIRSQHEQILQTVVSQRSGRENHCQNDR